MERVGIDMPKVTQDEATELMIHHLQLAACYFEACPAELGPVLAEVNRLLTRDSYPDNPAVVAARSWLREIHSAFEEMS